MMRLQSANANGEWEGRDGNGAGEKGTEEGEECRKNSPKCNNVVSWGRPRAIHF